MSDAIRYVVYLLTGGIAGMVIGFALALEVFARRGFVTYIVVAIDPDGVEHVRRPLASTREVARN